MSASPVVYCVQPNVVPFLPNGGLPNPAREAVGHAGSNTIESDGHGLQANAEVTFRAAAGGALPGGLVEETTYYALVLSPSRFSVASTSGGTAIDLSTDGENFLFAKELAWAEWMQWGARQIDGMLPAHVVPIVVDEHGNYPAVVVTANAELAAAMGVSVMGGATIDLSAKIDAIRIRLKDWVKGLPIRGVARSTQSPVNLAVVASSGAVDPRGWATSGRDVLP